MSSLTLTELLVRSARHDHTLVCQRSESSWPCDLGLTRTPAERGLPLPLTQVRVCSAFPTVMESR